jgi:dTDP-glucose 4,6-dehydratase
VTPLVKHEARRLLVSGGAGFIGTNFVRYWCAAYPSDRVVVLDALTYAGNAMGLADLMGTPRLRFVHGDICDSPLVLRLLGEEEIDTVVHFAAESHVDRSIAKPEDFIRTNINGTHSLLTAATEHWRTIRGARSFRFHHISTDEVFGSLGPGDAPFREDSRYQPNSPYAASKAASDHLVRAWQKSYGLPVVGTNCSNNFGPFQYPEKLIPLMIVNSLEGRSLPIYGDGKHIRDWLYVEDHCRAIDTVVRHGGEGVFYNVGGNNEWANLDLVRLLCETIDAAFRASPELKGRFPDAAAARGSRTVELMQFVKDRPGHDRRYAIDSGLIASELSFAPHRALDETLRATVAWYIANESWWRSVMDGSYRNWIAEHYGPRT